MTAAPAATQSSAFAAISSGVVGVCGLRAFFVLPLMAASMMSGVMRFPQIWFPWALLRDDRRPQRERIGDPRQGLVARPYAPDDHRAIVENTAPDRLDDVDSLDLVHIHLERAAADEAFLVDDPPVRHDDLRRRAAAPGRQEPEQPDEAEDRGGDRERGADDGRCLPLCRGVRS